MDCHKVIESVFLVNLPDTINLNRLNPNGLNTVYPKRMSKLKSRLTPLSGLLIAVQLLVAYPAFADIITLYPAYVRESAPLTQKLIDLGPKLSGQLLSLQQLSAINHDLHLLKTQDHWEHNEAALFSQSLTQTALDALNSAVQFWQDGNDLRYLLGENEQYHPFNRDFIQAQLALALKCIQDLKTLQTLRNTLDMPNLRYQIRPEFEDTRFAPAAQPHLAPDDAIHEPDKPVKR
jgi:hypothetical protein